MMQSKWIDMSSTYCISCEKQVGNNWSECYWCGGKKFKVGGQESSSVSYIPEEYEENLLPDPEDINYEDVELSVERVRELLIKDNLTESELDELSMGFIHYDELSDANKEKINMLFENFQPQYTTKEKIFSLFFTIILIAVISLIIYFGIKYT